MPFKKGHKLSVGNKGGGRKGYEWEEAELKKMRQILNRALVMTEHIQLAKAGIKEAMAYENSIKMVLKIMDKLHANREAMDLTSGGKKIYTWQPYGNNNTIPAEKLDTATPREPEKVEGGGSPQKGGQNNSNPEPLNQGSTSSPRF